MSTTTFLSNENLWSTVKTAVKAAHRVDAAIAYFGLDGRKLLPLSTGDRLVVNMSMPTVKSGGTNPFEIERLIKRGVAVYTRGNLHAKLIVADKSVFLGSANVSRNSEQHLDEAAIWTNDPVTVLRARTFIEKLCTEPVRPEYLAKCKAAYKPPKTSATATRYGKALRTTRAKLWTVSLVEITIPDHEVSRFHQGRAKAKEKLGHPDRSTTDSFFYPPESKLRKELEVGDWVVQAVKDKDGKTTVRPPGQLLMVDVYPRGQGKDRCVFHLELPRRGQSMPWKQFSKKAKTALNLSGSDGPRTKAIRDVRAADSILSLWTPGGRVARS